MVVIGGILQCSDDAGDCDDAGDYGDGCSSGDESNIGDYDGGGYSDDESNNGDCDGDESEIGDCDDSDIMVHFQCQYSLIRIVWKDIIRHMKLAIRLIAFWYRLCHSAIDFVIRQQTLSFGNRLYHSATDCVIRQDIFRRHLSSLCPISLNCKHTWGVRVHVHHKHQDGGRAGY